MMYTFLLLICVIVGASKAFEPVCSKFDYEEKLLEKMVRLEFQVSRMLDEMKEVSKSTINQVNEISGTVGELSQTTTNRINNLSESLSSEINGVKDDFASANLGKVVLHSINVKYVCKY